VPPLTSCGNESLGTYQLFRNATCETLGREGTWPSAVASPNDSLGNCTSNDLSLTFRNNRAFYNEIHDFQIKECSMGDTKNKHTYPVRSAVRI
jgi:hypothetical protein